jgi:hypothetical protein
VDQRKDELSVEIVAIDGYYQILLWNFSGFNTSKWTSKWIMYFFLATTYLAVDIVKSISVDRAQDSPFLQTEVTYVVWIMASGQIIRGMRNGRLALLIILFTILIFGACKDIVIIAHCVASNGRWLLGDEVGKTWQEWLSETTKNVRIINLQVWTRNPSNAKQECGTFNLLFYENAFQCACLSGVRLRW